MRHIVASIALTFLLLAGMASIIDNAGATSGGGVRGPQRFSVEVSTSYDRVEPTSADTIPTIKGSNGLSAPRRIPCYETLVVANARTHRAADRIERALAAVRWDRGASVSVVR